MSTECETVTDWWGRQRTGLDKKAIETQAKLIVANLDAAVKSAAKDRRDRIATAALQGYLASFAGVPQTSMTPAGIAAEAVEFADALIAELDREKGE